MPAVNTKAALSGLVFCSFQIFQMEYFFSFTFPEVKLLEWDKSAIC